MKYHRFACAACSFALLLAGIFPATAASGVQTGSDVAVENTQWTSITNANWINDLAFDSDGYLWAATSGGLVRWDTDAGTYTKYTSEHRLCSNQLSAVEVAPDGTIWLASKDNGISSLKDGVFRSYTVADGLPSNVINDIAVTPDGILWAATGWDICSFDGQSWQIYDNTPLKENNTSAILLVCDLDGNLWFGSNYYGVFKKSGTEWTQYAGSEELSSTVYDLALAPDGSVWATLIYADLVHYAGGKAEIVSLNTEEYLSIDCLCVAKDGALWFAEQKDISCVKDGQWETFDGDYTQDIKTTRIIEGPDGTIWCGGFMGGLAGYRDGEWTVLQTDDWLPDNTVYKVVVTETGAMWILTYTAVTYYDGETATVYPTDWRAQDLLIAPDQSVWVSLSNNGVYRLDGSQWIFCGPGDSQDGFEDNSLGAMLEEMETVMGDDFDAVLGDIMNAGFMEPGMNVTDDSNGNSVAVTIEPTQTGAGIELKPWYTSLEMDADGRLLCVTMEGAINSLYGGVWSAYQAPGDSVSDILISQQGVYWLSCYDGVFTSTDGVNWKAYPKIIDSNSFIYHMGSIYVTPDETCWIASLSGVGCQPAKGNSFYFGRGDGIPDENVSCVAGAPDGTIWIGTNYSVGAENGSGVCWYDGSEWHTLTAADGLASNAVHGIFADAEHVWFATHGGIGIYSPNPAQ